MVYICFVFLCIFWFLFFVFFLDGFCGCFGRLLVGFRMFLSLFHVLLNLFKVFKWFCRSLAGFCEGS